MVLCLRTDVVILFQTTNRRNIFPRCFDAIASDSSVSYKRHIRDHLLHAMYQL